jgi:hypothetical protein
MQARERFCQVLVRRDVWAQRRPARYTHVAVPRVVGYQRALVHVAARRERQGSREAHHREHFGRLVARGGQVAVGPGRAVWELAVEVDAVPARGLLAASTRMRRAGRPARPGVTQLG